MNQIYIYLGILFLEKFVIEYISKNILYIFSNFFFNFNKLNISIDMQLKYFLFLIVVILDIYLCNLLIINCYF